MTNRLEAANIQLKSANEHWHTQVRQMIADVEALSIERDRLLALLTKIRDAIDFTGDTWEMADEILCFEDEIRAVLNEAHQP